MAETPTTEMIRARYKNSEGILSGGEFDRWLAEHDEKVRRAAVWAVQNPPKGPGGRVGDTDYG